MEFDVYYFRGYQFINERLWLGYVNGGGTLMSCMMLVVRWWVGLWWWRWSYVGSIGAGSSSGDGHCNVVVREAVGLVAAVMVASSRAIWW